MSGFYVYFIATLPSLDFPGRPPFSFEEFIELAARFLPEKDISVLEKISLSGEYGSKNPNEVLNKWQDFDTALRNELVKLRAGRKHIETNRYLRNYEYPDFNLGQVCATAMRHSSGLEAEKILDTEKWHFLSELSFGHYFDLEALIIYGLKLLILERWEKIESADKPALIEAALTNI